MSPALLLLLKFFGAGLSALFFVPLFNFIYAMLSMSQFYKHLDGPPSGSFILGNTGDEFNDENLSLYTKWPAKYGRIYKIARFFG
ncbi:cytochrome p450 [Moniliophthora roreri MCA 2997]|nr:cytochrome p450 [Moniliophthora roreri MCA 2997]